MTSIDNTKIYFCLSQIMRLGQMFSNFGNKVKNFGLRVGSTLAKVAPKVLKVGSFVTGALSHLPGAIGTAAGVINKGFNWVNNLISSLPDSRFKNKLQDLSDKAQKVTDNAREKISPYVETAKVMGDTGGKIIDAIKPKII